jgi:hypothetical protein
MLELSAVGGGAILGCEHDCGTLSPGWTVGGRLLYRFEGVLAVGGAVDHARFRFQPEGSDEGGTIELLSFALIARVYPVGSGLLEPYVQVGLATLDLDSDLRMRSRYGEEDRGWGGWSSPATLGLDVYLMSWLRVGAWIGVAPLFISRVDEGNAMAVPGLPERPPQPVLRTLWSAGLSVTGVLDFGR